MKKGIIRVACLQLEAKSFKGQAKNKENILKLIKKAAQSKPSLLVLPECIYPCYFLSPRIIGDYAALSSLTESFLLDMKDCARIYQTFIALGMPEYIKEKNILYNSALLIDDNGKEIGRTRKSFLWHFDHHWFQSAHDYPVFDTKIGKIGLFVCADGRLPEIVRCLALQGAELLLDLTNLVTNGLEKTSWSNPQIEFMLPTRALENKVWIIAVNKVGVEEKTIQYCGKSAFFSPEGKTIAMASTTQEEILIKDIDITLSHCKNINGYIDVLKHRKPATYHLLALPSSQLPVTGNPILKKSGSDSFSAVIQIDGIQDTHEYAKKVEHFFYTLQEQEVNIFSFSQNNALPISQSHGLLDLIRRLTKNKEALCSLVLKERENNKTYKTMYLIESGKTIGKYRKTHLEMPDKDVIEPGECTYQVYDTSFGSIGMMLDYEGCFPEIARILALKGAEIIIWSCQFSLDEHIKICQARSAENKIFMICPNSIEKQSNGHSLITSPSGQIITGCLKNQEMASMTKILINLSHDKIIVPHTDAIFGRQPESYRFLTEKKNIHDSSKEN